MPPLVTIKDVAERAGVSVAVVSRVINDKGNVKPETERLVRAAIRELQYQPNPRGRQKGFQLSAQEPLHKIAFAIDQHRIGSLEDSFYGPLHLTLSKVCQSKKVQLEVLTTEDLLENWKDFDGVIHLGDGMKNLPIKSVVEVMGAIRGDEHHDRVSYHHAGVGKVAAQFFAEKGFKKVGMISQGGGLHEERQQFFIQACRENGLDVELEHGELHDQYIHQVRQRKSEALFLSHDGLIHSLVSMMQLDGKKPQKDLFLLGCNADYSHLGRLDYKIPSISLHVGEIAQVAFERLLYRLQHPEAPVAYVQVRPEIMGLDPKQRES